MTIAPPPRPGAAAQPRPPHHPAAGAGGGAPTIDPVRLLKQYKSALGIAAVVGLMVGTGAFFAFKRFMPQYRSVVTYQGLPVVTDIKTMGNTLEQQEFERFVTTQTRIMVQERVLREAVKDPRLKNEQVKWVQQYLGENGQVDQAVAARDLKDMVSARAVQGTNLIELSVSARDPKDAAVIANTIHDAYWRDLGIQSSTASAEQRNSLNKQVTDLTTQINQLEGQRTKLMKDYKLTSDTGGGTSEDGDIRILAPQLVDLDRDLQRLRQSFTRMESQLKGEAGPVFDDNMRDEAEKDPIVLNIKSTISELTTIRDAQIARGFGPEHKQIQDLNTLMEAKKTELAAKREEALRKIFETTLERTRQAIDATTAQYSKLRADLDSALKRKEEITRALSDVESIGKQIDGLRGKLQATQEALSNLEAILGLQSGDRVGRMRVLERAKIPDELAFPRLPYMLGAGFLLVVGLTGGAIVLKEVLDQRIKGPSDIAMIPRMRLLGLIPLAGDDPGKPAAPETAFKDCPNGAVAEGFRQLRPTLVKRLQQGGHRSLLLVGAMPGSGTTTVAANLGMACAAADQRVLLIDANMRRPALHKVFKLGEGPGLGEVLSRKATVEQAVQQTSVENLHLLSAGAAATRTLPERLATEAMTQLIREATERYDLVIIDTAPAMVAGDGIALANRCDAVALVVRALAEKRGLVARIRDQLNDVRAEFAGVVVNAVKASAGGYMKKNIRESFEYQNNGQA